MTVIFMPALGQVWLVITFSAAKINILRYHAIPLCEIINNPLAYLQRGYGVCLAPGLMVLKAYEGSLHLMPLMQNARYPHFAIR